jgi:uncharacterized iron-regulated protein
MRLRIAAISLLFLAACASRPATPDLVGSDTMLLLLGEQHDDPQHHQREREMVEALAGRGVLAAVALEMADSGASTEGLAPRSTEDEVRRALRWDGEGWPWPDYAPAVMAAVAAGVPVVGANLERGRLRAAMTETGLDTTLPGPAIKAQQQAIREGHCGLLPESQIAPMTRMQIARDRNMATTLAGLVVSGKTVLLIAGAGHVDPQLGVPQHLPRALASKSIVLPRPLAPSRDYCDELRRSLTPRAAPPSPGPSQ